jgi:hypothetical protein
MIPILVSCLVYSLLYFSSIVKHNNKIVVLGNESHINTFPDSYGLEKPFDDHVEQNVSNNEDNSKSLSIIAMPTRSPHPTPHEIFVDEKELEINER